MRDLTLAAKDDIEIVPLLPTEVRRQWPGLVPVATRLFGELIEVDEGWLAEGRIVVPRESLAGVVTFADSDIELAAALGAALGVRHQRPEAADKLVQRTTLHAAGLSCLGSLAITSADDLDRAVAQLGFPFVVKPRRGAGGAHVTVVTTAGQLEAIKQSWPPVLPIYAEQFIPTAPVNKQVWQADYVSVEVQSVQGQAKVVTTFSKFPVFVRRPACQPSGQIVTTGDILPCHLSEEDRAQVEELVLAAHKALPLSDGITHTEVKLGNAGPEIIEVNCRVGGHLSRLLKRQSDFDLVRQALLIAGGLVPQPLPDNTGDRSVAGMFVPFATDQGPVLSSALASVLRAAGAASVDELARQGAPRSDSEGFACNVVLDAASHADLQRMSAEFLRQASVAFKEDRLGSDDWTAAMLERLKA